jgi:hypothetical protein
MSKKLTSILLLFSVFIGFLLWGLNMLTSSLSAQPRDGEEIVYAILILICSFVALVAILKLPYKNQS